MSDFFKQSMVFSFLKTNRRWQLLGLALLTAIVVTACGGLSPNSQDQQYTSSNVDPTQLTRTVQHAMGETKVPATPKQVVALGPFVLESLVAIDAPLVGAPIEKKLPMLKQKLENVRDTGYLPNLETIVALNPDLIVGTTAQEQIYDQASQIAPTVLFDSQGSGQWKEILQFVGRAMNQPEAVQTVLSKYNQRLEQFRQRLDQPAQTLEVSVVRIYPEHISLYQRGSFAGMILEDAGLSRPPSQQRDSVQQRISKEKLPQANGDVLFLWTYGTTNQQTSQAVAQLKADPLWSQLEVVQEGKVYEVNGNHWIGSGPIAANLVIDDLFRYLVEEESS
jgi:iron complex transport system substrate-binding protein